MSMSNNFGTEDFVIGIVKWFSNQKGYGFISRQDSNVDVFAHHTHIEMNGYRTLKAGQKVKYQHINGPKGPYAQNISPLDAPVSTAENNANCDVNSVNQDLAEEIAE